MFYPYRCKQCDTEVTIDKPMKDCDRNEVCHKCGGLMVRVFKLFGIKTGDGLK